MLDLGFNKLSTIPDKAFRNITSLTLLALDGNPLSTLPFHAFQHLKTTLRGLSVGSKYLHMHPLQSSFLKSNQGFSRFSAKGEKKKTKKSLRISPQFLKTGSWFKNDRLTGTREKKILSRSPPRPRGETNPKNTPPEMFLFSQVDLSYATATFVGLPNG